MRISILGAGNVGGTLGLAWARAGHDIFFGVPNPGDHKTQELLETIGPNSRAGSAAQAAAYARIIVLATPWPVTGTALRDAGDLEDKIIVDCTNPLKADFTGLVLGYITSGAEQLAKLAPAARLYKAFNQTGFNIMSSPQFDAHRAVMFVCGDDDAEKPTVLKLVSEAGFEAIDAGKLAVARLLEPFGMLWIHLAYAQGMGRDFAFGLLRRGSPLA
jgi:8-hydroxy-5-deazaflavin:NADPH oxidoreductase